jgi:hypothetical protein
MINELEDELNHEPCLWLWLYFYYISSIFLMWVGINLYLSNQVLIKLDQLKLLIAVIKPVSLSLLLTFISYNSQHLLSINHKCTHACYNCCSKEKLDVKSREDDAEF